MVSVYVQGIVEQKLAPIPPVNLLGAEVVILVANGYPTPASMLVVMITTAPAGEREFSIIVKRADIELNIEQISLP